MLKGGKIFWFKSEVVTPDSQPRGVIDVSKCLSIKGAEDTLNKPYAFEISTIDNASQFFIADSDKEKEEWINAVGKAIVKHSRSMLQDDRGDYTFGERR